MRAMELCCSRISSTTAMTRTKHLMMLRRRRRTVFVRAGVFKTKEEEIVENYLRSKDGHEAIERAKKLGKSKKELLRMHKKDIVRLCSETNELKLPFHVISKPQRIVFASFLNAVLDIPILNEAAEQVLFMKIVDVIADAIERQFEKVGHSIFFEGVSDMGETQLDLWIKSTAKKMNEKIDIPLLNEKQEEEAIEYILHGMVERFLASDGKRLPPKEKKKMFGFI